MTMPCHSSSNQLAIPHKDNAIAYLVYSRPQSALQQFHSPYFIDGEKWSSPNLIPTSVNLITTSLINVTTSGSPNKFRSSQNSPLIPKIPTGPSHNLLLLREDLNGPLHCSLPPGLLVALHPSHSVQQRSAPLPTVPSPGEGSQSECNFLPENLSPDFTGL